tara:strand:+ start:1583 stop:2017 length:435 start_codon:yes stop_codon:yes gene_type:complete
MPRRRKRKRKPNSNNNIYYLVQNGDIVEVGDTRTELQNLQRYYKQTGMDCCLMTKLQYERQQHMVQENEKHLILERKRIQEQQDHEMQVCIQQDQLQKDQTSMAIEDKLSEMMRLEYIKPTNLVDRRQLIVRSYKKLYPVGYTY